MDKDRFRELLQSFEQLSVKPEAGGQAEFDGDRPADDVAEGGCGGPAAFDVERFLDAVRENGTSFPELEATHPPPDAAEFRPSAALTEAAGAGVADVYAQQQLHAAARFRLLAGLAARMWMQVDGLARDRAAPKAVRAGLAELKANLVAVCSANLVEAGQMEAQAARAPSSPGGPLSGEPAHVLPLADAAVAGEPALGARICEFASAWPAVTGDPWVLQT
ncbi:hypothetical protein IWQ56_003330, partial [Coemansia nantahalensis]